MSADNTPGVRWYHSLASSWSSLDKFRKLLGERSLYIPFFGALFVSFFNIAAEGDGVFDSVPIPLVVSAVLFYLSERIVVAYMPHDIVKPSDRHASLLAQRAADTALLVDQIKILNDKYIEYEKGQISDPTATGKTRRAESKNIERILSVSNIPEVIEGFLDAVSPKKQRYLDYSLFKVRMVATFGFVLSFGFLVSAFANEIIEILHPRPEQTVFQLLLQIIDELSQVL